MHKEILIKEQSQLFPLLKKFSADFGLVGGTAIALHIGHRRSIDFDLFSNKTFNNSDLRKKISKNSKIEHVFLDHLDEYTILVKGIKTTFFHFPFKIAFEKDFDSIRVADLLTLSALKVHALGRRAKWKDYIDLYFIMKKYYSIKKIIKKAKEIFGNEFNEKLFRTQLAYFKDIDYSEKIDYIKGFEVSDKIIKKELIKFSLTK